MNTPLDTRPRITNVDIIKGTIIRYFVQRVSTQRIYEVDRAQYDVFYNNPNYRAIKVPWIISGELDTKSIRGNKIIGVRDKNKHIVEYYNKSLPGLSRKLRNHIEYFKESLY